MRDGVNATILKEEEKTRKFSTLIIEMITRR